MELDPERKLAGVLAPVFALRSEDDLGCGDTAVLRAFIDWASAVGLRVVQVLPVNETGGDNSPYNALASSALDPTTLDVGPEGLPELPEAERARILRERGGAPPSGDRVDYVRVKALKLALLEGAHRAFLAAVDEAGASAFRRFREEHREWLYDYVLFRVLVEANGGHETFEAWPEGQRTAREARRWLGEQSAAARRALLDRMDFFAFVQWIAYRQWDAVRRHADRRGVALMGDLPFGLSRFSADVFAEPHLFDLEWSGGAPREHEFGADPFTARWGQNWGVPVYRWDVMRRDGHAWWKRRVSSLLRVFHLFRVDHILGFYRVYRFPWQPWRNGEFLPLSDEDAAARTGGRRPGFYPRGDDTPGDREANRREGEQVLRAILASAPPHAVVGEDLGVVPEYVPPSLAALGIPGMKVPMWQPGSNGNLEPGTHYPRLSLATYGTHDHDPLKALWDTRLARARGSDPGGAAEARAALVRLARFARLPEEGIVREFDEEIHFGLLAGLLHANSWLVIFQIGDLLGLTARVNLPGTVGDTNWTLRLPVTVRRLADDPHLVRRMNRLQRAIEETDRLG